MDFFLFFKEQFLTFTTLRAKKMAAPLKSKIYLFNLDDLSAMALRTLHFQVPVSSSTPVWVNPSRVQVEEVIKQGGAEYRNGQNQRIGP